MCSGIKSRKFILDSLLLWNTFHVIEKFLMCLDEVVFHLCMYAWFISYLFFSGTTV